MGETQTDRVNWKINWWSKDDKYYFHAPAEVGNGFYSEPKYDDYLTFVDEKAPALKDGKWGLINARDEIVLPFIYDYLFYFYDENGAHNTETGIAKAQLNGKYGYINVKGEEVIPFIYDEIHQRGYGEWAYALVSVEMGLNAYGEKSGGKWGVINRKGEIIIPIEYKDVGFDSAEVPFPIIWLTTFDADKASGFGNRNIIAVIDSFGDRRDYSDTESWYYYSRENKNLLWARDLETGLVTFIRASDGTRLITPEYDESSGFKDGMALVTKEGKTGFIDESGELVIPLKYDVTLDKEGGAIITIWKDYINEPYRPILKLNPPFDSHIQLPVAMGISPHQIEAMQRTKDWEARYGVNGANADCVGEFAGGLALVQIKGRYGYINKTGGYVVFPQYDRGTRFKQIEIKKNVYEMRAAVRKGEKWAAMDTNGKLLTKFRYKSSYDALHH